MKCTVNFKFFFSFFFWHFRRKRKAFAIVYEEICEKNSCIKQINSKMHFSHIPQCYMNLQDVINLFIFNHFRNFKSEFLLFKKNRLR